MLPYLLGQRPARLKWEASLAWFRLRYQEAISARRCLRLLARPQACGRVALYYRPGKAVSQLYLGVPETHVRLLQRMAPDFHCLLSPQPMQALLPAPQPMTAMTALPWDQEFVAHLVGEALFVTLIAEPTGQGHYLPRSRTAQHGAATASWQMPSPPPPGLSRQSLWSELPPASLVAAAPDPARWLLGRTPQGAPLHVAGQVNVYGRAEAAADWVVHLATQMAALQPAGLIVLDGRGDVVPQLKRKETITRLLGEKLIYVDLDGPSLVTGFNPLAPMPDESGAQTVQRWRLWFEAMNVHPRGVQLLASAYEAGIRDIPALQRWLKQAERQGMHSAVSSLTLALGRLTASRYLREWLEWPVDHFRDLSTRALLFTCRTTSWDRQVLFHAALLMALAWPSARLIVHGYSWKDGLVSGLARQSQALISNGPLLSGETTVLVETTAAHQEMLARRFLRGDARLSENLALLRRGEGMVVYQEQACHVSWLAQLGQPVAPEAAN